ncbi:hypothetical protein C8D88_116105 [Lentzea atacamensis]|uniref:Uncharacterized protein n=1 Tax=Lentzea atacamensis TaxID=531938 RepID=A0A316HMZ8_9PSEU|nr:hypothetical protein [Lentzea atacamensis]PWK81694.1 hypothetical protein C8D88_116105 [Lentzea atacamensis]
MSNCDVCGNEPMLGVASIPGMPISVAYGRECLKANAHPWWALVGNTALLGGLDQAADWWQDMVRDTCRRLGKTLVEFNREVAEEIRSNAGPGVDAFSVCTCNAEDETKCSRCGVCERCHGACDCRVPEFYDPTGDQPGN